MVKNIFLLLVFVILSLNFKHSAYAVEYFYDDFSNNNLDKWDFGPKSVENSWSVVNGKLMGSVSKGAWSTLYAKWNNDQVVGDYKLTADVENISGVDQTFYVRVSEDRTKYYQIGYRYDEPEYTVDSNNITLFKFGNGVTLAAYYPSSEIPRTFNLDQGVINKISIILSGRNIKVYFNQILAIDYIDNSIDPILTGGVGLLNWSGACPVSVDNIFDNFRIASLDDLDVTPTITPIPTNTPMPTNTPVPTNTPMPTSTPVPTSMPTPTTPPLNKKQKIIVIPGLGASWNSQAMVYNDTVSDNSWKMTPFVNNYNKLIKSLEKNGLIKDKDFFVWNYDWRKPVSEIVNKLDQFINQNIKADETVSLVGHSLGGLTARIWSQNHEQDERLNKAISLGGPQSGAVSAYEVWNGAKIENGDISGIALNILLMLQKNKKPTKVETIRNYAPVIKDLLPVFDYAKRCNKVVKFTDLANVNNYLLNQNNNFLESTGNVSFISGVGESTKEWINLDKSNIFDRNLGIWPDGRVISYAQGNGDNTVLKKSANLGSNYIEINSNHADIVDRAISIVMTDLGLTEISDIENNNNLSNKLIYFIGSPAKINVSCDNGLVRENDIDGFLMIDNFGIGKCVVKIIGTGDGTYHLVTGKSGQQDSYRYFENNITAGQTETVVIDGQKGIPFAGTNDKFYCKQIKKVANNLLTTYPQDNILRGIIDGADKCNLAKIVEKTFNFRRNQKETERTNEIIDYIRELLIGRGNNINNKVVETMWKKMLAEKSIVDKMIEPYWMRWWNPTVFRSMNYVKISDLINDGNMALLRKDYGIVLADLELIKQLMLHFW